MTPLDLPGEEVLRLPIKRSRPKGLAPWTPRAGSQRARILEAAQAALELHRDRWPLGSREVAYVLTGDEFGFTHDNVDEIEDVLSFARRAGLIPWEAISDSRTGVAAPWTVADGDDLAEQLLDRIETAQRDRQAGQRYRVETWAEAMGWLPRLETICNERGVPVYSGSGSVPVSATRAAAIRAVRCWAESVRAGSPVTTVLLTVGDLDLNGIRNIARPFVDDVTAFVTDLLRSHKIEVSTVDEIIVVRRLLLTAEQVEKHVGERGRTHPSGEALRAGWPYPFTAQAEALPPDVRDRIVTEAIDALHDVEGREQAITAEAVLHADARTALRDLLDGGA